MPEFIPLTPEQAAALACFARTHGRAWTSVLRALWSCAAAEPVLQRLRKTHGPAWLAGSRLEVPAPLDFTAHADPVLAVPCPVCRRCAGTWCVRPSGHRAHKLHAARAAAADAAFLEQHGQAATIELAISGAWVIDPRGRARD